MQEAKLCRERALEYARNAETTENAKSKEHFAKLTDKLNKLAYELERTQAILAAHLDQAYAKTEASVVGRRRYSTQPRQPGNHPLE